MKHVAPTAVLLAVLVGPALADDNDRKQSYWDGRCKVEREWKKNGDYKEERKCDGRVDSRRERKEEFRDGPCKIKREWKKNGDYVEERQCDGRSRRGDQRDDRRDSRRDDRNDDREDRRRPAYPPWVVVAPGGGVPMPPPPPQPGRVGCSGEAVGQVLGGVAGGVIGHQAGKGGDAQGVATVGGIVIGVLIGGEVGRRIDAGNQACIGAALEYGGNGQRVQWMAGDVAYTVVPGPAVQRQGAWCRPYDAQWQERGAPQRKRGTACRRADGTWVMGD